MRLLRTSWGSALAVFVAGAVLVFILEHGTAVLQWLQRQGG